MAIDYNALQAQILALLDQQQSAALGNAKINNKMQVGDIVARAAGSGFGDSSRTATLAGRQADEYSATQADIGAKFAGEKVDALLKLAGLQGVGGSGSDGSSDPNQGRDSMGFSVNDRRSMYINEQNKNAMNEELKRKVEEQKLKQISEGLRQSAEAQRQGPQKGLGANPGSIPQSSSPRSTTMSAPGVPSYNQGGGAGLQGGKTFSPPVNYGTTNPFSIAMQNAGNSRMNTYLQLIQMGIPPALIQLMMRG